MPVGKQDHSGIPVAVAVVTGCLHQPLDLLLGEILPHPVMRIGQPTASNCSLFGGWRGRGRRGIHWPTPINQSITSPIMDIFDTVQSYERVAVLCPISLDDANAVRLLSAVPATPLGLH